ncbi:MAG: glutamate racemase [Betaproteobacteria bacterium]|nr:glutamate racemase [Betaproteobacteria bacterium]
MTQQNNRPIAVFDSGVGGLTVARALLERLPREQIIYFGDTARVPYGVKSAATITQFTTQITRFLLERQVKLLVIACNSMAAVACDVVRDMSPVPVLDVLTAGALRAHQVSRNRNVAVIGTPATVSSGAYTRALHGHDAALRVVSRDCPLFVPLAEEGWFEHEVTRLTAQEYLTPVMAEGVDTLILGCTHYPLLKPVLARVVGEEITLVDSADSIADQAAALLAERGLGADRTLPPVHEYYVTDLPLRFRAVGERFLGRSLENVTLVQW